jgi:hypothetical protein
MKVVHAAILAILLWSTSIGAMAEQTACYGTDLPIEGGEVKSLRVRLPPINAGEDQYSFVWAGIQYWGLPDTTLAGGATCHSVGDTLRCSTDCSVSNINFRQLGTDTVLVELDNFSFGTDFVSEASYYSEPGTNFVGVLVLSRREDAVCSLPEGASGMRIAMTPGDVSRYVEQAKTALSTMGYPVTSIDRVFDLEMQEALRTFQSSIGFPVTGHLDAQTLQMLKVHSEGTGC